MTDYKKRLLFLLEGQADVKFYTRAGTHVATGYERVVIGERGPYIEFRPEQLNRSMLVEAADQHHTYYRELRGRDEASVKVYGPQLKKVNYADYKVGMCYISPFDLTSDRYPELVTKLPKKKPAGPMLFPPEDMAGGG